MPFNDLREYIARLEREGEVQRIEKEVDPVLEVGAVMRRSYDLRAPAPFFLNLKGYPKGRIFGAPISLSRRKGRPFARFAISMEMPPESSAFEIIEEYIRRIRKPIKPVLVRDGPCKENILAGDAVDLEILPSPLLHQGDGGRYLGTWHANITKDPDTGVHNWGLYRLMVHDKNSMGGLVLPVQNIGLHYYTKYEARGQPMEFAIAMGTEPVTPWVAGTRFPPKFSEADIIGLKYMAKAGFDPRASVDLWQNMAALSKKSPPEFLSTHPTNETRIENLISEWQETLPIYNKAREDGKDPQCEKNW